MKVEERGYAVLGEKEKTNTTIWFISSILMLLLGGVLFVLRIFVFRNLTPTDKSYMRINIVPFIVLIFGIPSLVLAIWDKRRPDTLIMVAENKEKIKVFASSKWKEIEIKDILQADKRNFRSKFNSLSSGSIYLETTEGRIKVYNLKSVDHVWYEINSLIDNSKIS